MSFKIEDIAGIYAPTGNENFGEYLKHLGKYLIYLITWFTLLVLC